MNFRKILSLSLSMLMLLAIMTGCGSSNGDASGASQTSTADGSAASDSGESKTEASGDQIQLELFGQKPEAVDVVTEFIKMFEEENPDIKITYTNVPDSHSVLLTRISSNEMPDMMNSYPAEDSYKIMFDDGLLLDLTDKEFMNNVEDTMLDLAKYNDKYFALPITLSAFGLYYNVDMFEEHGQTPPTTYAEFEKVSDYFKENNITPLSQALKDNTAQLLERGIGIIDNENYKEFEKIASGDIAAKDAKSLDTLGKFMLDIKKYAAEDAMGVAFNDSYVNFSNGDTAMVYTGTWALSQFLKNNPDANVAMVPMPTKTEGYDTKVPVNIDTAYSIFQSSPNQEAALKFFEFLSRTEVEQIYADKEGNANLIKGVENKVEQHKAMNDKITSGETFLTSINFWPTGLREDLLKATEQLLIDEDIDAFKEACGEYITQRYQDRDSQ